jgi:hypothetical protein
MSDTSYYFLPWVRYGLLKNDQDMPTLGENAFQSGLSLPERAKIIVNLKLNDQPVDVKELSLSGPGDLAGIDSREIVRTEPRHLTPDFLPNLFPFIEFDRPDFPWLFTPGKPDANGCLLPWIVLVVLRKENGKIITDPTKSSPELECDIKELPDLKESWAWAHAQYIGASKQTQGDIPGELAAKPLQNVSRLICPRKLQANDHYMACVVPAFKVIKGADQNGQLAPAWKLGDSGIIRLPVYYQWEFSTAMEGDFEDFIKRLKMPGDLDEKVQETFFRRMDVASLFDIKPDKAVTLDIISALELETANQPDLADETILIKVKGELKSKINSSQSVSDNVPLPIYGSWHVKKDMPGMPSLDDASLPAWCKQLNTDPRYRVAAALGTQVIQRQQEQLMTAAWEQASGWEAANQLIRQNQLAEKVTNSIFKRINSLSDATFMQITEPVAKAVDNNLNSIQKKVDASHGTKRTTTDQGTDTQLEKALMSASCRRLLRSQGHLFRRGLALDEQKLQQKSPKKSEVTTATGVAEKREEILVTQLASVVVPWIIASYHPVFFTQELPVLPELQQKRIDEVKKSRLENIRPDLVFSENLWNRLEILGNSSESFRQLKINKTPSVANQKPMEFFTEKSLSFPQPMYEPLRDLFQEMLIPGIDQIPNNSLVILKTNPAFIEAYLVGLNHEMSRELVWREYPTQLGNTYFQKFWDDRGSGNPRQDIAEIRVWEKELGGNIKEDRGNLWILLIKGDLLTRYPNAIIYAQKEGDSEYLLPVLRVSPVPGVTLLGFDINIKSSNDNWFFILQEHPTETRFGLDTVRGKSESLTTWRNLIWEDVLLRNDNSGYIYLKPDPATEAAKKYESLASVDQTKASWAKNSAHMAYITLQKPYRITISSSGWFLK